MHSKQKNVFSVKKTKNLLKQNIWSTGKKLENEMSEGHSNCVTKSKHIFSSKKNSGMTCKIKNTANKHQKVVCS